MTLKIISSEDVVFEGEVRIVNLPGANGSFAVLKDHASLVSTLVPGKIGYETVDGENASIPVMGGLVDVDNNIVSVCLY